MSTEKQYPPVVGTLAEYSDAPFARRTEWAQQGDLVRITGSDVDHHMAVHPDHVEEVLFDTGRFTRIDTFASVFGEGGILTVDGDQWRAQRQAMRPAFVSQAVQSYVSEMREITRDVVDSITAGETLDVRTLFSNLTMEVMLEILFGGSDGKKETISEAAEQITEWFLESTTAGEIPPEVQRGLRSGRGELTELIDEMVERRDGDEDGDLLSMLVALGTDSDANYTRDRVRHEMITMLFAAHETTALTITYTVWLLAGHPTVEREIRDEIQRVADGSPGYSQFKNLSCLNRSINESLRLYPPTHSLYRKATEPVELGDYTVPAGDIVDLPQWVFHRDERWWDEPLAFHPERFGEEDPDRPRFAFFLFGAGPRRCIGETFARAEVRVVIAELLNRFSFDRETEDFDMYASLTAVPDRPVLLTPTNHD